jgi:hypothetical protein
MSRVRGTARSLRRRAGLSGGFAAAAAVPLLLLSSASGLPVSRVDLTGGGAWLASPAQGLVTLIDGASEQVVGSVRAPGAQAGDDLSVVQAGSSAYVLNATRGTVSRVDGGTYQVSAPIQFGTAGGSLGLVAGGPGVYVVDGSRRVASVTDPVTMRVRQRLSLAAEPGAGQSVVDAAGRLWVVDSAGGGLTWFDGGKRVRPDVGDGKARLVLVEGRPVLVDVSHPRVGRLGADGGVPAWSCLDIRAGDRVQLLGSAVANRVYAAVPAAGTLVAAGVDGDDCNLSVEIGSPGDEFGPLVETGQFVLVPDRTSGRTVVVDTAARQVVASLEVVKPGARLELLVKDGVVFYNDLDGDRAGVIRFDGGQWQLGRSLQKYNRSKTGEGILTPSGASPKKDQPPAKPDQGKPKPGQPPASNPANPPGQQNPGQQSPGQQPSRPDPNQPPPGQPQPTSPTPSKPAPPPPPQAPVIRSITVNPDVVVRELEATFTAKVDNALGATWAWTILDPATGATLASAATPVQMTVILPAGTPANLQVRLEVTSPRAGAATPFTQAFTTTSSLTPQIDSLTASNPNAGISEPLRFTAVESVAGSRGTWTWSVAGPGGPSGPIPGTPGQELPRTFDTAGDFTVTLTVTFDGASDEASVPVTVADRARLVAVTGSPVDMRAGTSPSIQARVTGSFVPQGVGIRTDPWLQASDFGGITVQPGGTASFLVGVRGTPPVDGLNSGAVTMSLSNGSSVTFDVLANVAPSSNGFHDCLGIAQNEPVHFFAGFNDANPATLAVTLRVGSLSVQMDNSDGGGAHAPFAFVDIPRANLPNVQTWTVQAVDEFGAESEVATGQRGQCW